MFSKAVPAPPTPAPATAAADSQLVEASKVPRARKARTPSVQSASPSNSSGSISSSDAEPSSPRREPHARQAVVIESQGAGKVMQRPDGTVVWEPEQDRAPQPSRGGAFNPAELLSIAGATLAGMSMVVGLHATTSAMHDGPYGHPACLTSRQLTAAVAHSVTCFIAGTTAGMVLGPLVAARAVASVLVRPAVVGLLVHGGIKCVRNWRSGVAGLLRKLQSADPAKVMEALRAIIAAAGRSPKFAREFNRLAGMEALLQRLAAAMPDCPLLHMLAQALAELCRDQECRDSLVSAGGVPRLVALLDAPNPVVVGHGLAALSRLTDHALAVEAIREAGGPARLVQLASDAMTAAPAAPSSAASSAGSAAAPASAGGFDRRSMLLPAVRLLQALSLDPASKTAIGAAGGVPVLLEVVARGAEPRSEVHAEAVAALHNALRGCPDNQRALAALPAASEVLRGALGGYGPCWHPAKGDLHALLNVLARLQGVQEAGGFVVIQSQAAAAAAGPATPAPASPPTAAATAAKV